MPNGCCGWSPRPATRATTGCSRLSACSTSDRLDRALAEMRRAAGARRRSGARRLPVPPRAAPRGGVRRGAAGRAPSPAPSAGVGAAGGPVARSGRGPGHRAAELASHWWAAEAWAEAVEPSVAAADAAVEVWAFPEALAHIERRPRRPRPRSRRRSAGRASTGSRCSSGAPTSPTWPGPGLRSVELAREAIAPGRRRGATRHAWRATTPCSGATRGASATPTAPSTPIATPPTWCRPSPRRPCWPGCSPRRPGASCCMSRYGEAERAAVDALAVAEAVGARAEEGHLRYTLGCCRASMGLHDEGIDLVRQALAIAEEVASADDLNRAYMGLSSLLVEAGRLEEAADAGVRQRGRGRGAVGRAAERRGRQQRGGAGPAGSPRPGGRPAGPDRRPRASGAATSGPPSLRAMLAIRWGRFDEAAGCWPTPDA